MEAVSWGQFRSAAPALSAHVEQRLKGICYLATVRADGSPRVHPVGINVRGDRMSVPMFPTSPKGHDIRRSGRYAVHGTVEDNAGGGGEVLVTGIAVEVEATEDERAKGWVSFELLVGEVQAVDNRAGDDKPVVRRWRAGEADPAEP